MTNNLYAQIRNYLQYQRDIGVTDIVFEHGSEIKKLLRTNIGANIAGHNAAGGVAGHNAFAHGAKPHDTNRFAYGANRGAKTAQTENANPFAKLAGMKPASELGLTKFETQKPRAAPHSAKRESLAALYREVQGCQKCSALSRTVFGAGSADGFIFIIGGAPSSVDIEMARPFRGEVGELLNKLLDRMGLDSANDIFTTYLQKCGSIFNVETAEKCRSILDKQIDIVKPKVIIVFGETEAKFLLNSDNTIEQLRNAALSYKNTPLFATYDLPTLIERPELRHGAWSDMQKVLYNVKKRT